MNKYQQTLAENWLDNPEKAPTRNGLGEGLLALGKSNPQVVALCADLTESTRMDGFAKEYPSRFIEMGVAEQNLVTTAAGLAAVGKIPFASSYAAFAPGRCWEQIRTTICYNDQPVKLVGSHAGLQTGPDGATHQMLEDIALMRVLPNMTVIVPTDAVEAKKATIAAAEYQTPVYIRLQRDKTPIITTEETPFEIGKAYVARPGQNLTIITTGAIAYQALLAAESLNAQVVIVPTIKPLDTQTLDQALANMNKVVTVEEHQVAGGLGSAVAEHLIQQPQTPQLLTIGVNDRFGESGAPDELIKHFGLDSQSLIAQIKQFLD